MNENIGKMARLISTILLQLFKPGEVIMIASAIRKDASAKGA